MYILVSNYRILRVSLTRSCMRISTFSLRPIKAFTSLFVVSTYYQRLSLGRDIYCLHLV